MNELIFNDSTDSTTFDLAGMNLVTIENVVREAFTDPMELKEMIRLTFITGAGKLGRAKYDDKADKAMTSTLKELGYNEDRGASAVMECAGLFKLQHDTGKNLKTVVVFPKMNVVQTEQTTESNRDGTNSVFVDDSSPRGKLVYASIEVFKKMVEIQCVTWSQKKVCVSVLVEMQESLKKCDETLLKGQQLSTDDQQFYDTMNSNALDEKSSIVRDLMQKQVKDGFVTADEKQLLLSQIEDKIKELESECLEAESNSKPKLLNKLRDLQTKAVARKEMLDSITPRPPPKLKHAAEIAKLYTELAPLLVIEESCKGRLLSLKESQTMARKDEIQAEILSLEVSFLPSKLLLVFSVHT